MKRILKFIDMKKQNYNFELKTIVTQNTGVYFFRTITSHENSLDYIHFN